MVTCFIRFHRMTICNGSKFISPYAALQRSQSPHWPQPTTTSGGRRAWLNIAAVASPSWWNYGSKWRRRTIEIIFSKSLRTYGTRSCDPTATRMQEPETRPPPVGPSNSGNLSLSERIVYLRYYYDSKVRINPKELQDAIDAIEKYSRVILESGPNSPTISTTTRKHGLTWHDFRFLLSCCTTSSTPALRPRDLNALAERIWALAPVFGIAYSTSLFNALLRVFRKNRYSDRTHAQLVEYMNQLDLPMNAQTMGWLLELTCQRSDMKIARDLYDSMREMNSIVPSRIYDQMIYGYLKARDEDGYRMVTECMEKEQVPFTASTYTSIMKAYAELGNNEAVFERMEEADTKSIVFTDGQLLSCAFSIACTTDVCGDHIDKILNRLREWKLTNFIRLVQRLLSVDRIEAAWKVFISSPLHNTPSSVDDEAHIDTGNFLIEQLFQIKSPPNVIWDLCKRLQESGLNRRPYLTALKLAFDNEIEEMAITAFSQIRDRNYDVRPQYLTPLLILMAKRGAMIEEMLEAVWLWFRSLRVEDRSDRLLDDAFFGMWFWPWSEHARRVRSGFTCSTTRSSTTITTADMMQDLNVTMDSLVRPSRHFGDIRSATSGNVLTGFVHHCLINDRIEAIAAALKAYYPNVHLAVYKLHVALARFYQRTGRTETVVSVLRAAGRDPGDSSGAVGFKSGNGALLSNLRGIISLEKYTSLLEKMAEADLSIDTASAREILKYWSNDVGKNRPADAQCITRLRAALKRLAAPS